MKQSFIDAPLELFLSIQNLLRLKIEIRDRDERRVCCEVTPYRILSNLSIFEHCMENTRMEIELGTKTWVSLSSF